MSKVNSPRLKDAFHALETLRRLSPAGVRTSDLVRTGPTGFEYDKSLFDPKPGTILSEALDTLQAFSARTGLPVEEIAQARRAFVARTRSGSVFA